MQRYFSKFPTIQYPYTGSVIGQSGTEENAAIVNCTDLMVRYRIRDEVLRNPLSYYTYVWRDGDRPDSVAEFYYGDSGYAWLVCLSGGIFDWLYDLPMPQSQFIRYLEDKYGKSQFQLMSQIHHYEDEDGFVIDKDTYDSLNQLEKKTVMVYDHEFDANEAKRQVKLLDRTYTETIDEELSERLEKIKDTRALSTMKLITGNG